MYCANHPKVETALSCGRCSTPICTDCSVSGAVGMLCRKCAYGDGNPLFKVRPERFAFAVAAGVATGVAVGFLLQALSGFIFYLFIFCAVIGGFIGQVILWASGFKRGRMLEYIAAGSVVVGAVLSTFLNGMFLRYLHDPMGLALFVFAVVLTAGAAMAKIRF